MLIVQLNWLSKISAYFAQLFVINIIFSLNNWDSFHLYVPTKCEKKKKKHHFIFFKISTMLLLIWRAKNERGWGDEGLIYYI